MNRILTISCITTLMVVASLLSAGESRAQGIHTTASNMGLGGGGGAYMTGYHANFINPANLMMSESGRGTRLNIGILGGLSTSAGGGLINLSLYNEHFTTGQLIDSQRVMEISDAWFGSGSGSMGYFAFNLHMVPFGLSYRGDKMALSTAFRVRSVNTIGMSKGMFELALTGLNAEVFDEFKDVNLTTEIMGLGELSFGYAMEVWRSHSEFRPGSMRVFAGVAPKILYGMGYAKIGFESRLQVTGGNGESSVVHEFDYYIKSVGDLTDDFDRYYQERRVQNNEDASFGDFVSGDSFSDAGSVQGQGFGLDIGATWEWYMRDISIPVIGSGPQILRASFSITDIGSVNFDNKPGEFRATDTFTWEGLNVDFEYINEEHGEFSDYFDYVLGDSIGNDIYGNFTPREVSSHKIGLNPMLNLGGALSMGRLAVIMDLGKGFNDRGINSRSMYAALGTEYRLLNVIPLRFGMRVGGYSSMNLAFGSGISSKRFEFTASVMTTPNSKNGGVNLSGAWSGLVFRF